MEVAPQPPPAPERRPSVPRQEGKFNIVSSANIASLDLGWKQAQVETQNTRTFLNAATEPNRVSPESNEYKMVQRRLLNGESQEMVQLKSAVNFHTARERELVAEQAVMGAKSEAYYLDGVIPGSTKDLLGVLDKMDKSERMRLSDPMAQYVQRRIAEGTTPAQLREEVLQQRIPQEQQLDKIAAVAQGLENRTVTPQSSDYQLVAQYIRAGWTPHQISEHLERTMGQMQAQRLDYKKSLSRLAEIPDTLEKSRQAKDTIRAKIDHMKLAEVRGKIQQEIHRSPRALSEEDRRILKQRVFEVMKAPLGPQESRGYFPTAGQHSEVYYWQLDSFGRHLTDDNDMLYKGYLQVDLEDIPRAVEMLREVGAERLAQGIPTEFKWLLSKFSGNSVPLGEYARMADPEPRIAIYSETPGDIEGMFKVMTEDPRWSGELRAMSDKRSGRSRRPGTSAFYAKGVEWRGISYNDKTGISEKHAADPNWRNVKQGPPTVNLKYQ